jgi:hypothetical protein
MSETKKQPESGKHQSSPESTVSGSKASGDTAPNRLSRFSGIWKDNPDLEEFREHIDESRREVDEVQP